MKNFIPDNVSEHTNVYDVLKERGFIEQTTDDEAIRELLGKEKIKFYIGFDPTADCLHVGHFMQVIIMMYMQKYGHTPVVLLGGGTGMVGDPSGRTDMRKMMTVEMIDENCNQFKKLFDRFIEFDNEWKYEGNGGVYAPGRANKVPEPGKAISVNNAEWLRPINYVEFLREIGPHFSVNEMLRADCYKQRMERGLTFFELSYMLMQSYDFLYLHDKYGCKLQMGGNDQWSNILGGVDLIRRIGHSDSYGLTFKLLTTKEGKKMGKTEKGALWLDATKTSPYDFYQYWRNIDDADVKTVLSLLTFLPMEKVEELSNLKDEKINEAKKVAAYEITKLIHGEEEAKKAEEASNALFGGQGSLDNMPTATVASNISILDAIIQVGFAPSKGQARQLITQGGISLNDTKISDTNYVLSDTDFKDGFAILKKGKKSYYKLQK